MFKKLLVASCIIVPYVAYKLGRYTVIDGIYKDLENTDVTQYTVKNRPNIYVFTEDAVNRIKDYGFHFEKREKDEDAK